MAWQDRPYYQEGERPRIRVSVPMPSPMTTVVMAVCLGLYLVQSFGYPRIARWGAFTFADYLAFKQPWRWVSYQYFHSGAGHIFWNLLGVYFFLPPLERLWGWRRAFLFYSAGGIAGCLVFGLLSYFVPGHWLIGASGSIFAALGACAYLFPEMSIWFIPIRLAAALWGIWFLLSAGADRELSDAAHLGGLVFGFFAPFYCASLWHRVERRLHYRRARRAVEMERLEDEMVDRILQKVHDTGMHSLTRRERKILRQATERQRLAEASRGRRAL